ncbi:MAG: DUF805 domain-containing protein [Gammaproteobacteria bacterium]|nr:DUF805 domain-containing protein [Gammaproteobacteria bacterium]
MNWYLDVLKNYAVFGGRARRKEYWMFFLFNIIVTLVLAVIDGVLGTMVLAMLYSLAVLIPGLAVTIRRLHDTGRSGWWVLIALIPAVGGIILLIFMLLDGTPGPNKFGPSPK